MGRKYHIKITFCVLIIMFLFSSCSKYEEGPSVSLLPKKYRLKGTWELIEFSKSGNSAEPLNPLRIIEFNSDNGVLTRNDTLQTLTTKFKWKFSNNSEEISLEYDLMEKEYYLVEDSVTLSIDMETEDFEILRLKKSELWLKGYFDIIYKFRKK